MFRGVTHLTFDDKGRFAMPARYRDEILASSGGRLIITADPDHCLLMYPQPVWEQIEAKLIALPNMDRKVRALQRLLIGHASECEMSKQGRVSVSPALRQYASLSRPVTMVGQGEKFELWDTELWQEKCDEWAGEDSLAELGGEALGAFSL